VGTPPPIPADDAARVQTLRALGILDTPPEQEFDAIVRLAAEICGVPIALVSLVDESRQWFKAKVGLDAGETPRDQAWCAHAINEDETMVVPDASKDPRFVDHPLRLGAPNVEFYAGVPLRTSSGHAVGTLCVIDHAPRNLSPAQRAALEALAAQVVRLLELRRTALDHRAALASLEADAAAARREVEAAPASGWSRGALLLAGALGVASVVTSLWVRTTVARAGDLRLAASAARASAFLAERARSYGEVLRGAGALFRASDHVTREEFRAYVDALNLPRDFPGLLGLGFSEAVPRAGLDAWLAEARLEQPDLAFRTTPADHPVLAINRLVEPYAPNRPALGYDVMSEPVRRAALARATRTGDLARTDRVRLLQDPEHAPGLLLYVPVPGPTPGVPRGWVFAAVRERDLVAGIAEAAGAGVEVRLTDERAATQLLGEGGAASDAADEVQIDVAVADRPFELGVSPGPSFWGLGDRLEPWAILFFGFGATALAFALTTSIRRTEVRSQALAGRMTRALRRGERELRAVIEGTTDLIVTFDRDGHVLLRNGAFRRTLGDERGADGAPRIHDVVDPEARPAFAAALAAAAPPGETRRIETVFRAASGAPIEVEGALTEEDEDGHRVTRAIFRDVSARKQAERALVAANQALEQLATSDGLTGLANRRTFDEHLAAEVGRARRGGRLALVLLDVDHFKTYNDHYGHLEGDACLRAVAGAVRLLVRRAGEVAARYGGEEFALLLPGSDLAAAAQLAELVRARIAGLALPHARHPAGIVTASFGVAVCPNDASADGGALIKAADAALYRAKAEGRNRVAIASGGVAPA
jgi:diguanylate cyclase (GGDEF)-like protein/PAS domain S-box-containing protein